MGNSVFENILKNKYFEIKGIILPKNDPLYFDNIKKKKLIKKSKFYILIKKIKYIDLLIN